jgi:predicted MFS family arabinose efflux permease
VDRPATQANPRRYRPAASARRYFTTNTVAPEAPAWAPFKSRVFRWLWIGVLISWTGTWMQTVGGQWLVVDAPNASRAVGPALAGVVIAHFRGVPVVFALNAASVIFLAVALLLWHRESAEPTSRERFVSALRAGGRYVWHEPVVRRIMLRAIMFVAPAMGLWAQLPVIASQHLRVGTDGFGALFAALGTGAIVGALLLGRLKNNMSINGILTAGAVLYAAALAVIIFVPSFPIALATLVLSGVAWMAITSTLQAEMQLVLPGWVRDRGMALYTVTFMGSQTAGALICGVFRSAGDGVHLPPVARLQPLMSCTGG